MPYNNKEEKEINKYDPRALGRQCFICHKVFTVEEIEKSEALSKVGLKNIPVLSPPLPGFLHRRCRGITTQNLIENPTEVKSIEKMKGELL